MQTITPGRGWLDAGPDGSDDPIDDVPDAIYALALRILADHRNSVADGRSFPPTALYAGSNSDRQRVGRPGHCSVCAIVGHVAAHPELGCCDVRCTSTHDTPNGRRPKINIPAPQQANRRTEPANRTGTEAPTGTPDEAFFAFDLSTGSPGAHYAAYRFGTTVVEAEQGGSVRFADHPDVPTARARFASATCDPEGAGAPRPGDLVDVYGRPGPVVIETVRPHRDGGHLITWAGRRTPLRVVAGTFEILARPE